MTREELIALACRTAVSLTDNKGRLEFVFDDYGLESFAAMVAATEREACAKLCDGWTSADGDRCAEAIRVRGEW
jgi:hypothetical protein